MFMVFIFAQEFSFFLNGTQIASASSTAKHLLWAHFLSIVGQTDQSHRVDEQLCQVEIDPAVLGGGIVLWKCVMIVVEAFADGANAYKQILHRIDSLIVLFVAPFVSYAVD